MSSTTLTPTEQLALRVAAEVYADVRHAPALDAPDHWDRFANRLRSAAYAQTASAFLEQVGRRFGVAHTPGEAITELLELDRAEQRQVLRTIRSESNALSVLVRAQRMEAIR